ncbi:hypothetical protein QAO71_15010 [Halopseudomonas sp. SMJS2]|uniref:hypothetical protein n=1 Tax=Halopseudomonas sp. SMJS2 TaxID=3041098 RepID=UPI002452B75F|nr:hypothetical protein [Halopseudomonas sp. SMJS2]WGK61340.1 hypothetical protein QAO71_15010 [Halopseudomonas sp. SMJS2]
MKAIKQRVFPCGHAVCSSKSYRAQRVAGQADGRYPVNKAFAEILKSALPIFPIYDEPFAQIRDINQFVQSLIDRSEPDLSTATINYPSAISCVLDPQSEAIFPIGF